MASEAQVRANRLNAKRSTGPRTVAGKAVVAQNAVKHGLCTRQAVIAGEDVGEFEFYRDQMLAELGPEGLVETTLAQRAVGLAWRLRRAERLQNEAFDVLYAKDTTGPLARLSQTLRAKEQGQPGGDEGGRDLAGGRVVVRDFAHARVLDRLLMYERRIEHSLYKTMAELERLRLLRQLEVAEEAPAPGPAVAKQEQPHRAKQTQSTVASAEAKCSDARDVGENVPPSPAPKQSQTNPTWGQTGSWRSQTGGSQAAEGAVYSGTHGAGCDAERSAGAVTVLR